MDESQRKTSRHQLVPWFCARRASGKVGSVLFAPGDLHCWSSRPPELRLKILQRPELRLSSVASSSLLAQVTPPEGGGEAARRVVDRGSWVAGRGAGRRARDVRCAAWCALVFQVHARALMSEHISAFGQDLGPFAGAV